MKDCEPIAEQKAYWDKRDAKEILLTDESFLIQEDEKFYAKYDSIHLSPAKGGGINTVFKYQGKETITSHTLGLEITGTLTLSVSGRVPLEIVDAA